MERKWDNFKSFRDYFYQSNQLTMNKPNITLPEYAVLFAQAPKNIKNSIQKFVDVKTISQAEADAHVKNFAFPPTDDVKVFAIRGYYKNTMGKPGANDRGLYDDALSIISPDGIKTFNGNTDPRKYGVGVGMLLPGVYRFKPGLHGYKRKGGPIPAFRTNNKREVLPVVRDGQKGIKEGVTINIHPGGEYEVNSIACQTVIKSQWPEFYKYLIAQLKKYNQVDFPYMLTEE